ncbi:MAG TPA: hypothetical protein PK362_00640 [Elusimicrobiota bacterium]|nr:hypothetical protein [Elusimicrobiota bacterium]
MNRSLERQIVFFTVVGKVSFGDLDGCATVEVLRGRGGRQVAAGPTRSPGRRETAVWVDDGGRRRLFRTAVHAMAAVERERPGESLHWCRKVRLQPSLGRMPAR